jgi:hypothetical protein
MKKEEKIRKRAHDKPIPACCQGWEKHNDRHDPSYIYLQQSTVGFKTELTEPVECRPVKESKFQWRN